ncbi:hypothetical protein BST39_17055 [Mycobacterium paraseoulense]|uniref:Uncharacterized protein n=1 Tax=Mycobacterium paraseoulense TaxID=590652 RepID=A0A1X0I8F5_9MYCO|nr:hypothetical protein BST39_17055 [Mycobacterium paraseoulense]
MAAWVVEGVATVAAGLDDECVAVAAGVAPLLPNPSAKATAEIPPTTATAVFICALIGRSLLSPRVRGCPNHITI